jgi:hypothetical protein
MRNRTAWTIVAVLTGSGLAACFTVPAPQGADGHYVGYVRLAPAAGGEGGGGMGRVASFGAWLEMDPASRGPESLGLGFRRAERVVLPLDCRFAIIVKDAEQMSAARELVESLEGKQACAIDASTP